MTTLANKTQGYDPAGNLTLAYSADRGTSYVYRYDHHNRMTGIYDSTNTTRKAAFTYDALGRRVEFINDVTPTTTRYYYDGVNEVVEDDQSAARQKYYVHGISYIDERLMMYSDDLARPFYYVIDRMYNVRMLVDRAGSIVERYLYDGYGQPYIRESCGRGDMNNNTVITSTDGTRFDDALATTIWDPRADLDDDGDVDSADEALFDAKGPLWYDPTGIAPEDPLPTVAQAFSDFGNWYMFQGVPHLALDTQAADTSGKLMLNHHRARYADPVTGRWASRDPLVYYYAKRIRSIPASLRRNRHYRNSPQLDGPDIFCYLSNNPIGSYDPTDETINTVPCSGTGSGVGMGGYNTSCGLGLGEKKCQKCGSCTNCGVAFGTGSDSCGGCTIFGCPLPPPPCPPAPAPSFSIFCCNVFNDNLADHPGDCTDCCVHICDPINAALVDLVLGGLGGLACHAQCHHVLGC
jgi:hypothetical protein